VCVHFLVQIVNNTQIFCYLKVNIMMQNCFYCWSDHHSCCDDVMLWCRHNSWYSCSALENNKGSYLLKNSWDLGHLSSTAWIDFYCTGIWQTHFCNWPKLIIIMYYKWILCGAESLLRRQAVLSQSRNYPHCMEPKVLLRHTHVPATRSYPEPAWSIPCPHIPLLEDPS